MMLQWFEQGSIAIPKLLMMHYKKLGLNETEFMVVLHVHTFLESGNSFPTPSEISERMTITEMKCMEVIQTLIQKGFFITRRWTKIRSDDVRKLFFTTVMGKKYYIS